MSKLNTIVQLRTMSGHCDPVSLVEEASFNATSLTGAQASVVRAAGILAATVGTHNGSELLNLLHSMTSVCGS